MPRTATPTAVLLFSRSATEEVDHKRFSSRNGRKSNIGIANQLINHAKIAARGAAVDWILVGSDQQVGHTFGERITYALESHFRKGYQQLIVIGNDCPSLNGETIRRAVQLLEQAGAVVGPALDGGAYLIGVSRQFFQPAAWCALPWKESTLGLALIEHLTQAGARVHTLPRLSDVDDEKALKRVLRQHPQLSIARRLRSILASEAVAFLLTAFPYFPVRFIASFPHRGPPCRVNPVFSF